MTDLDKNMPNRIRVEHILGIDDKNQQGNLSKSQGSALQAWNDLQSLLDDAVWGKGAKVGGQSYLDALNTLLSKWTGPAADEFKKQAGKISTFGAQVSNKIDGEIDTKIDSSTSTWNYSVSSIQAQTSTSVSQYHSIVDDFTNFAGVVGTAVSGMLGREMRGGQQDHTGVVQWKNGYSYAVTWKTKHWVWLCPDTISAVTVETWGPNGGYSSSEIHDDHVIHDYDNSYAEHVLANHGPTFDPQFADLHNNLSTFYNTAATQFPMGLDTSALPTPDLSGHPGGPGGPGGPGSPGGPGANPGGGPHMPGGIKTNPTGTHPNPTGTHPNPSGNYPNPTGTHPNPTGTHPNPTGTYPNPGGTHTNPGGGPSGTNNNGGGPYHLPNSTNIPNTTLPGPGGIGIPPYQTTTAGYTPNTSPLPTGGLVGDPSLGGFQGGPGPLGGSIGNPAGGIGGGFNPAGGFGGGLGNLGGSVGGSGEVSNPAFAAQGVSAEAAAARQAAMAGQAAAGEAGMAGRMPMMPPMAPMGMNGDKGDRARRSWIPEDADLWGTGEVTSTPPVIGG